MHFIKPALRLNSSKTKFLVIVSPSHQRLIDVTKPLLRIEDSAISQCICAQPGCHPRCSDDHACVNVSLASWGQQMLTFVLLDESGGILMQPPLLQRREHSFYHRYANALLAGLSKKLTNRFQIVQKNAAQIVTPPCTYPRSHITPALQELHCLFDCVFCTKLCVWLTRRTILQPHRIWATWYSDSNTRDPSDQVQMVPCWL